MLSEERLIGGGLGRPSGARFRTYERLKRYADDVRGELFDIPELKRAIDEIYRFPLRQAATDALNRQLRSGITDQALAELVITLRDEDRLCIVEGERETREPQIICSLGLAATHILNLPNRVFHKTLGFFFALNGIDRLYFREACRKRKTPMQFNRRVSPPTPARL